MGLQLQNLVGKQIKGTWQNTLLPSIFLLLENETLPWGEGQFDVCEEPSSGPSLCTQHWLSSVHSPQSV